MLEIDRILVSAACGSLVRLVHSAFGRRQCYPSRWTDLPYVEQSEKRRDLRFV